ncbi:MAG: hypothetical protein V2J12_08500 [Gammaproteobacteria bacterium]|nr:hypothetical protein [Gammaproteobacteria bacterium]
MAWALDIAAGLALGLLFFALVRLRMIVAPWLGAKVGQWARWSVWVAICVVMIAAANLELWALRQVLHQQFGLTAALLHELVFAVVGFGSGFLLITRYVTRRHENTCAEDRVPCGARLSNEP